MTGAQRKEVAVAVLLNQGRVWIQERRGTGHLDGFWEFPGGKIHQGETPLQAVMREVREETGIDLPARLPEPLQTLDHSYPERLLRLHFFLCRLNGPEVPEMPDNGLWVELPNLGSYTFPAANRPILDLLRQPRRH